MQAFWYSWFHHGAVSQSHQQRVSLSAKLRIYTLLVFVSSLIWLTVKNTVTGFSLVYTVTMLNPKCEMVWPDSQCFNRGKNKTAGPSISWQIDIIQYSIIIVVHPVMLTRSWDPKPWPRIWYPRPGSWCPRPQTHIKPDK